MNTITVTLRTNIWELDEDFKPDNERFTQMITTSKFSFPVNGSDEDKSAFCKNEIKDYQLLTSLYFKIEVFENGDRNYATPLFIFEDFGTEKSLRTHIIR
jgi:hypothetical protein